MDWNPAMRPASAPAPQPNAVQQSGVYPMAQAYRQYLQQPAQGAHMSYNQFVESQGGPSPGMQQSGPGMGGGQSAGNSLQGPVSQEVWNAYRALPQITGKGFGAGGRAARAFTDKYGMSYDPEGLLAKAEAVRGMSKGGGGLGSFATALMRGGLPGKLGDISQRSTGFIGNTTAAGSPFIGGAIKKGMGG